MKLLTSSSIAALATLFSVSAASASDLLDGLNDPAPAETQAQVNWTGLWVGAFGGMSFFNTETDYSKTKFDTETGEPHEWVKHNIAASIDGLGAEGLFGEIQAGYDQQINQRLAIGVFGGVNLSDATFSASASFAEEPVLSIETDYEWGGVLGPRLGFIKSPDTMFYIAGGWAFAKLGDTTVNGETFANGPDLNGWFGELGMETRVRDLGDNVYLTISGRYTDYGSETLWSESYPGYHEGTEYRESIEVDTDALAAMVGLKAKLGGF